MHRIGVVGGGIAGLAAATLLARAGHAVELFERAAEPGPAGAGLLLQPSGQAVLRAMGLLDPIVARSEPIAELLAEQVSGRTLIRIPYASAKPEATGYGVARGLLFATLFDAARDAGVEVRAARPMSRVANDDARAFLVGDDDRREGPFDFVVAADGRRSALRETCGLPCRAVDSGVGAVWATGPCTGVRGRLLQVVRGTRILVGLLPVGGGRASFFWGEHRDRVEALRAAGFPAFRERVLALVPSAAEIFDELDGFERTTFATYTHVRAPGWVAGRVVFLGDAAHAMSPHLGQGANLALADAAAFAAHLARSGRFAEAAAAYDRERRARTRAYSALSRLLTPFFQSESAILGLGRDLALPLLSRLPPVARLMSRALAGGL